MQKQITAAREKLRAKMHEQEESKDIFKWRTINDVWLTGAMPLICGLLLVAWGMMIPAKLDGLITFAWTTVFAPVWAMFAVVSFSCLFLSITRSCTPVYEFGIKWQGCFLVFAVEAPLIIFALLVSLQLDGTLNTTWAKIFIPIDMTMIVGACVAIVVNILGMTDGSKQAQTLFATVIVATLSLVANCFTHSLKLDGVITASWRTAFAPLWIAFGSPWLMWLCAAVVLRRKRCKKSVHAFGYGLSTAVLLSPLIIWVVFLVAKADGIIDWTYISCWIPAYIGLSLIAVGSVAYSIGRAIDVSRSLR
eukprot:TRINITY_DN4077_c0_g1_i1.p1 TRINITY_DN4077_c0_g1~~TRINITY_DN4077_c0_g1_i1.p1  ORF type:complete len:306 (-),score=45.18 TRINITY_DN4077_c0_g1_i1:113-1030(-)